MNQYLNLDRLIHVGTLGKPFGVKGEITCRPKISEMLEVLTLTKSLLLGASLSDEIRILSIRPHGDLALIVTDVALDGLKNLTNKKVYVRRLNVPYNLIPEDLLNVKVYEANSGNELGFVSDFADYGSGVLVSIKTNDNGAELMLQFDDINFPDDCFFDFGKIKIILPER